MEESEQIAPSDIEIVDFKKLNKEIQDIERRKQRYKGSKPANLKVSWAMQNNHNLIYCAICSILLIVVLSVVYIIYEDEILALIKGEEVDDSVKNLIIFKEPEQIVCEY